MHELMMVTSEFSSDEPNEDMAAPKLRATPDRNRSKQKHDENTIYIPHVIWGVI
jgi:hypothetical protein